MANSRSGLGSPRGVAPRSTGSGSSGKGPGSSSGSRTGLGNHRGVAPRSTGSGSSGKSPVPSSPQGGKHDGGPVIGHGPRTAPSLGRAEKGVNAGKR